MASIVTRTTSLFSARVGAVHSIRTRARQTTTATQVGTSSITAPTIVSAPLAVATLEPAITRRLAMKLQARAIWERTATRRQLAILTAASTSAVKLRISAVGVPLATPASPITPALRAIVMRVRLSAHPTQPDKI